MARPTAVATIAVLVSLALSLAWPAAGNTPTLVQHPIVSSATPVYLDGTDWTVYRFGNVRTHSPSRAAPFRTQWCGVCV